MIALRVVLGALVATSWVYWILCADSARLWRRRSRMRRVTRSSSLTVEEGRGGADDIAQAPGPGARAPCPSAPTSPPTDGLGEGTSPPSSLPPISILKPLRGDDPEQYACFGTFCEQDYPKYEILFGAVDPGDPGLDSARKLACDFPERHITVVAGAEEFGANLKVCTLESLSHAARNDLLVLCDSDMRVGPDYLRRVTAPFADSTVGLVTCTYRGFHAHGLASKLEALGIGADFIPSVLLTERFWGTRFAFGSTIVVRREALERIGGFRALADELADDYRLGMSVKAAGWRIVLSDYVVDDALGSESLRAMWSRRLRWARTARAMQQIGWAGAFVTHGTPLALLLLASSGFAPWGWGMLASTLAVRGVCAVLTARSTGDPNPARSLPLLPLSDLLTFALWVGSFLGNTVTWRGRRYRIGPAGRLEIA